MTNSINHVNPIIPPCSGVTINIVNPAVNVPYYNADASIQYPVYTQEKGVNYTNNVNEYSLNALPQPAQNYQQIPQQSQLGGFNYMNVLPQSSPNQQPVSQPEASRGNVYILPQAQEYTPIAQADKKEDVANLNNSSDNKYVTETIRANYNSAPQNVTNTTNIYQAAQPDNNGLPNAYPQTYYINNYNSNPDKAAAETPVSNPAETEANAVQPAVIEEDTTAAKETEDINTDISKEIINELDERRAEQKEVEKNAKKTKIVSLTNEYIMSLENYLNNPNTDIRLMAAKEILTRLDEDKSRYNDAALNALLNKMLQDPNKLIRIAALGAFASELACGNDFTVELLKRIQQDPQADPEDVLEASQILLKRTTSTEIRYVPVNNQQESEVE